MKKHDTLNSKTVAPKESTIRFLKDFSKSIAVVKLKNTTRVLSKN